MEKVGREALLLELRGEWLETGRYSEDSVGVPNLCY